jgi:hypothetical protein
MVPFRKHPYRVQDYSELDTTGCVVETLPEPYNISRFAMTCAKISTWDSASSNYTEIRPMDSSIDGGSPLMARLFLHGLTVLYIIEV